MKIFSSGNPKLTEQSEFNFQSTGTLFSENDLQTENEKNETRIANLQTVFGISDANMTMMFPKDEHFNHQY